MRLWGGRFKGGPDALMRAFNDSFPFDQRFYAVDIQGSQVYARALAKAGLLTEEESQQIVDGLQQVLEEFEQGRFESIPSDEDIHTAVERRLTEIIGAVGGKLHTGRSRNDQAATDTRLYMREAILSIQNSLADIQQALVDQAEQSIDAILPGYTHLQPAQPIRFSHWLLSYFWAFERDQQRLSEALQRTNVSVLGAGALAGNPFAVDREWIAQELGMNGISENSLDSVSARDYVAEFLFASAMIGTHISRLAEDLIIYVTPAFRFVRIDDAYSTGSSLMPQKRNPDSLELARGKVGRLLGNLIALLTVLKGTPSTYNKDFQEDKEALFDSIDTLMVLLPVVAQVIATLEINQEAMRVALVDGMLATDLADYLVRKGMPFREAHHVVGQVVQTAEEARSSLADIPLETLKQISEIFDSDVSEIYDFAQSVENRAVPGGTSEAAQQQQLKLARQRLAEKRSASE